MNPFLRQLTAITTLSLLMSACAAPKLKPDSEPPMAFHDTRLQFALVAGENAVLAKDFGMKLPPSWVERTVAGAVLPFTAATETLFWPYHTGIKNFAPTTRP
jgi:hypothetical protein